MKINISAKQFAKIFSSLNNVTAWIGNVSIGFIILVVFFDVCGRFLLNKPLLGTFELVEQTMVVASGTAILYTTVRNGHVSVDLILLKFSTRIQKTLQRIFSFSGFVLWLVMAHQAYLDAVGVLRSPRVTGVLGINPFPFQFLFAFAILLCSLALLILTFISAFSPETPKNEEKGIYEP
jgi:TRAP-type transport system small permease protein